MQCVNPDTLSDQQEQAIGGAPPQNVPGTATFNQEVHQELDNALRGEQIQAQTLTDYIYNTINQTANIDLSQVNDPNLARQAQRGAMAINAELGMAGLGNRQTRLANFSEALQGINPANYNSFQSFFLNLATGLKRRFAFAGAPLEKFFLSYTPSEGTTSEANPRVRALNDMDPRIAATFTDIYNNHLAPILKTANEISRKTGLAPEEVRTKIGQAVYAQSMPEMNAYLLRRKQQDFVADYDKHSTSTKPADIKRLENAAQEIYELETAINDPEPFFENGHRKLTAGYSNPEAELLFNQVMQDLNIDRATLEGYTQQFRDAYKYLQELRAKNGNIGTDILNNPELQAMNYFFPVRTKGDIQFGFVNDTHSFNPGSLHERQGMRDNAHMADAYSVLESFAKRTATEIGTNDLALQMYAIAQKDIDPETGKSKENAPIWAMNYDILARQAHDNDVTGARWAQHILKGNMGGALVANIPQVDANGNTVLKRYVVIFNPDYTNETLNLTGRQLNEALAYKDNSNNIVSGIGKLTSKFSTLFTKYTGTFALVNYTKDAGERFLNMGNQTYVLEDGTHVSGAQFRLAFASNQFSAMETLGQYMRGVLDPDSTRGKLMQEYVSSGLKQEFTLGQDYNNEAELARALEQRGVERSSEIAKMIWQNPTLRGLKQTLSGLNEATVGKVLQFIESYNDFMNNIAPLTQYLTLREHGVTADSARSGVRELMNLRTRGTWTSVMRMIWPFIPPTIQGGIAMMKGLGLAPNAQGMFSPTKPGAFTFVGLMTAYGLLHAFLKDALGTDEDGNVRMDSLPITDLARYLPIPLSDGNIIKLPLPFGGSQIAATLTVNLDRYVRGKIAGADLVFDTYAALLRNISPLDLPTYFDRENPIKSLVALFTPMLAKGAVTTAMNINNFGRTLTFEQESTGLIPLSEQGRASTSLAYHQMARWLHQTFGLDLAPEQYQNLVESYLNGPLKIFTEYAKQSTIRAAGIDQTTQEILGPVGTALGVTMIYKHIGDLNRWSYYDYKAKVEAQIRELGIRPPAGLENDERYSWYRNQLSELNVPDNVIQQVILLDSTDKELRKLSRELNTEIKRNGAILDYGDQDALKERFVKYAEDREEIYRRAIERLRI